MEDSATWQDETRRRRKTRELSQTKTPACELYSWARHTRFQRTGIERDRESYRRLSALQPAHPPAVNPQPYTRADHGLLRPRGVQAGEPTEIAVAHPGHAKLGHPFHPLLHTLRPATPPARLAPHLTLPSSSREARCWACLGDGGGGGSGG